MHAPLALLQATDGPVLELPPGYFTCVRVLILEGRRKNRQRLLLAVSDHDIKDMG